MFNQFIKNINSSIESFPIPILSMQQQQQKPSQTETPQQFDQLVSTILQALSHALSEKLGEPVEVGELGEGGLLNRGMEAQLVQAKEKYNDLAGRASGVQQQARKISTCVGQFITSINLFLESEELLVPLREIQKGINELSADRVEKQINYLIKIFEHNFEEVIAKRITQAQVALHDEIKLLKVLNKNLENELLGARSNRNQDESKVYQLSLKISTLTDKTNRLNNDKIELERQLKAQQTAAEERISLIAEQEKQIGRLKGREAELLERLKTAETKVTRSQRSLKEQNSETEALNAVIERLKLKQQEISQQLQREARKREAASECLRKKLQNEKVVLEEQLERHRERLAELESALALREQEVAKLTEELRSNKEKGDIEVQLPQQSTETEEKPKEEENSVIVQTGEKHKVSLNDLMARLNTLQNRNKELQEKLKKESQGAVNKEVMKGLFLSYDDESKEWSVRRNIKHQICSLLDLKDRLPPEEPKTTKWFGLF